MRSHPESLIVTARNKMGTGKEFPVKVGLAGKLVETTRIRADRDQLDRNRRAGQALAAAINASGIRTHPSSRGTLYKSVPVDLVRDFLRMFRADAADPLTDPRLMSDYIDARADSELKEWDILFASASKDSEPGEPLAGLLMKPFERKVSDEGLRQGVLAISGTSRRVGSPGDEREGLSLEELTHAEVEFRRECPDRKNISPLPDRFFRIARARPLLIVRLVTPKPPAELRGRLPKVSVVAWTISFPQSQIDGGTVEYVVNTIRMREMFGQDDIEMEAPGESE